MPSFPKCSLRDSAARTAVTTDFGEAPGRFGIALMSPRQALRRISE